jgi:AcrR family transcriptional regulator
MTRMTAVASRRNRSFLGLSAEQRRAQRRARLVEAGLDTFGGRGFHAIGVRDVCAAAKLTERYFYESFKNLEDLFLAVYDDALERLRRAFIEALARSAPDEMARAGIRASLEMFRDDPRLARILLIEVMTVGAEITEALEASQRFADHIGMLALQRYPDLPERGFEAGIVGNGLYGSTVYIAMRWAMGGFQEPLEQILEHCVLFYEAVAEKVEQRA